MGGGGWVGKWFHCSSTCSASWMTSTTADGGRGECDAGRARGALARRPAGLSDAYRSPLQRGRR
eukprot:scaffold1409_cov290-Prasinococcus_capsulatus_cf.AAC.2